VLCLSYYCLYCLFNKIRDKGKTVSAWKCGGGGKRERVEEKRGGGWKGREWGEKGENDPNIVCTYE
jgi:hypothetical protein